MTHKRPCFASLSFLKFRLRSMAPNITFIAWSRNDTFPSRNDDLTAMEADNFLKPPIQQVLNNWKAGPRRTWTFTKLALSSLVVDPSYLVCSSCAFLFRHKIWSEDFFQNHCFSYFLISLDFPFYSTKTTTNNKPCFEKSSLFNCEYYDSIIAF